MVLCCVKKGGEPMAQKKLLTNGKAFKRTDLHIIRCLLHKRVRKGADVFLNKVQPLAAL